MTGRLLADMSDREAQFEAVLVELQLTDAEVDEVMRRIDAAGHKTPDGKVPSRLFILESRGVLAERQKSR